MCATRGIRPDMRYIECGKNLSSCYGALPPINVSNEQSKGSLSEPRRNEGRLPEACSRFQTFLCRRLFPEALLHSQDMRVHPLPQSAAFWLVDAICFPNDDIPCPVSR